MRDTQRQRVYDAEHQVRRQLELAAAGARTITVAASSLVLPLEVRFGTRDAAQRYADAVIGTASFREQFPAAAATPLRVRARRGDRHAHYEAPDTIAVHAPDGGGWALREMVLLHEIAHHAAHHDLPAAPAHGPDYTGVLVRLVTQTMGPEVGLLLTTAYADHAVAVTHIPGSESSAP